MQVVCEQKDLLLALNVASKAISTNNTLPILNNILLRAEGQKLYFASTNLEIAITYWINTEIKNEGTITIPAKLLTSYISLLSEEKVTIAIDEGSTIKITSPNSKTKINGLASDEFPTIPTVEKKHSFEIEGKVFREAIEHVAFAAAAISTRPVLSGVLFQISEDDMRIVATDSYRLAEKKIKLDKPIDGKVKIIIPAKTIHELGKLISDFEGEKVTVILSDNQVLFKLGTVELVSRIIDGTFPDYQQIIPKNATTTAAVKRIDLIQAIRRVSLFAKENNNNNIKVGFSADQKLSITTDMTQIGVEEAEVTAKIEGEDNRIALNAAFVLDVLNALSVEEVTISMESKLSPATIRVKESDDYLHVVMPLRL